MFWGIGCRRGFGWRLAGRRSLRGRLWGSLGGCANRGLADKNRACLDGQCFRLDVPDDFGAGLEFDAVGGGDGRTTAIILGTMAGAAIGGSVGRSMADTDRLKAAQALETVRTGVPTSWVNPDSGNEYRVVPTRTIESSSGPCREYTIDAVVGGKTDRLFGVACRQADGSWQVRD